MANHHFVVLQLPGGRKSKYTEGASCPIGFCNSAAALVNSGKAKVISARCDTGGAEEIRWHVNRLRNFKTFILVKMRLRKCDGHADILKKAVKHLNKPGNRLTVVDATDKFQLIAA